MRFTNWLWAGAIIIVLLLTIRLVESTSSLFGINPSQPDTTSVPKPDPKDTNTPKPAPNSPPASPRDQHWKAQTLLIESNVDHRDAVRIMERWNEEIEPLRNSSDGQVVAANQDLLEKLAFVLNRKRMSESDLQVLAEKIKSLTTLLEKAAAKANPDPLPMQAMTDIGNIHADAKAAKKDWDDSLKDARAVVLKARLDASQEVRTSLQQKLEELQAEQVVDRLEKEMEVAKSQPLAKPAAKPAAANAPEPAVSVVDPELRAKALSPRVKSALAVFLKARNLQPAAGVGFVSMKKTFDKKPMSYGRIESLGALGESTKGLVMLARLGGHHDLGELRWTKSWSPPHWSEADIDFLKVRQKMLIDYGPILVEEGLLSQ